MDTLKYSEKEKCLLLSVPVTDIVCVYFLPPQNEHENDASKRDAEAKTRDSGKKRRLE